MRVSQRRNLFTCNEIGVQIFQFKKSILFHASAKRITNDASLLYTFTLKNEISLLLSLSFLIQQK